jgi:ADP-heptose:LPS heptosyltransferase
VIASDPFWDRAPGGSKGKLIPFVRALRDIRRTRYDVAVLASPQWRIAAALTFADVSVRIGRGRRRNRRWLTHVLPPEDRSRPVVAELGGIVQPLGVTPREVYRLDPTPLADRMAFLAPRIPGPSRVALHAFAGDRARCVPLPVWRAVADALVRRDIDVVWIGSPRELAELRADGIGDRWYLADSLGTGALSDSIALVALCDAFIGHDSGPLHIAAGLGVPVLGMFTPGEPQRTFPQGPGASRMIARPSPAGVTAEEMLSELDRLVSLAPPTRARR